MNKSSQKRLEILISRYLNNSASQTEMIELQKRISGSKEDLLYFQQLKNIWDNSGPNSIENKIDSHAALKIVRSRVSSGSFRKTFWLGWQRIAAVLLIPFLLGNLIFFTINVKKSDLVGEPVYNELFAAFGTRSALKLSDGTSVWLNSGSSIKYPDRFIGNNRTIYLKGEAYFEVESNPQKPFIVETPSISVEATGTKFNVSGYPDAEETGVTLVSGKVEVAINGRKTGEKKSELLPNQHFSFSKVTEKSTIIDADVSKYICWKDGKLIFRNEPLSKVVDRIGQIFNVEIEIEGDEIKNYAYRATFQDESLSEILKLLKISAPINYFEVRRNPLPDGTFPRKKILIFPAKHKEI